MTNRKTTARKGILVVLAIFLLVAIIGGTYARYISTATGSGDVNIAKWAVKVGATDISKTSGTFNLTFDANNADTVANKVAPGGSATAYVDVDLSGTEVSVDFTCALGETATALEDVFGTNYASKVTVSVGTPVLQGSTTGMTLDAANKVVKVDSSSTTAMSGTVRVPITLTWTNADGNNAADSNTGAIKSGVTIPVTLSVQQHIGS